MLDATDPPTIETDAVHRAAMLDALGAATVVTQHERTDDGAEQHAVTVTFTDRDTAQRFAIAAAALLRTPPDADPLVGELLALLPTLE